MILIFNVFAGSILCGKLVVNVKSGKSQFFGTGYGFVSNWCLGTVPKVAGYRRLSLKRVI